MTLDTVVEAADGVVKADWNLLKKPVSGDIEIRNHVFGNTLKDLERAIEIVKTELDEYGIVGDRQEEFLNAFIEGLQNVQFHTNHGSPRNKVYMNTMRIGDDYYLVALYGDGPGRFDINKVREAIETTGRLNFGESGRGTYIMREWCDMVYYHFTDDGNYCEVYLGIFKK